MNPIKGGKDNFSGQGGPVTGITADGFRGRRGVVRRATFADFDAILDINEDIYEGLDYIPALFYVFMQSKQYAIYVYEVDGQLVALSNFYFVPGADDLVTFMSGRVRHSFKGQGFGRPERNPITDQFRRDHPHVTRYMIQTWLKPNIQAKIDQWKPLYHWNYLAYRLTDRHHLARPSTLGQYSNPRTKPAMLSYAEGCDWLKRSEQLMNFLSRYAEDYIVAGAKWIPIKINNTELRKLFADNIVFISLAGTKGQPVDGRLVLRPSTDERFAFGEDDEIAGFSSSNIFQCKYGVNFEIQFYGDSEVDLLSHVYCHMLHYVRVTQDDVRVACSLHFPLSIDSNCVREHLREELGDIFQAEFCSTQVVHYITPFGPPMPKM